MLINGKGISTIAPGVKVSQNAVDFGKRTVQSLTFDSGGLAGFMGQSYTALGVKTCTVSIIIHATSRNDLRVAVNKIVQAVQNKSLYKFDGITHYFYGVMTKYTTAEMVPDRMTKLTLTLQGQEVGERYKAYNVSGMITTINNPGNYFSPAEVQIVAKATSSGAKGILSGLLRDPYYMADKDFIIQDAVAREYVLSGENGLASVYDYSGQGEYYHYANYTIPSSTIKPNPGPRIYNDAEAKAYAKEYCQINRINDLKGITEFQGLPYLKPGTNNFSVSGLTIIRMCVLYRPVYV